MKKKIVFILLLVCFSACLLFMQINKQKNNEQAYSSVNEKIFFAMGTVVHIIYDSRDEDKIAETVAYMDNLSSQIKADEEKLSSAEINIPVILSNDSVYLYRQAKEIYKLSQGRYDPAAITVSKLYGFPDKKWMLPDNETLKQAKENAGLDNIFYNDKYFIKKKNTAIDFSAASKGYIVDKTVQYMKKQDMKNFIVNAGGDLYADGLKYGKGRYKIYIEKPGEKQDYLSIIKLKDKAVATSGNYERYFIDESGRRITHIFSGNDFEPVNNYQSVSVIADSAEKADAYATLFFLMEFDEIKKYCKQFNTPVLLYTLTNNIIKLCGWSEYEN